MVQVFSLSPTSIAGEELTTGMRDTGFQMLMHIFYEIKTLPLLPFSNILHHNPHRHTVLTNSQYIFVS